MAISKGWIVAGVVIGGVLTIYLVAKQKKKTAARSGYIPPGTGTGTSTGAGIGGSGAGQSAPPGPAGTNVYSKAGMGIFSSPEVDNGWFNSGLFGNLITQIDQPNVFVGNIVSNTLDTNGDKDASGNIYTWYLINPVAPYGYPGGAYYVREDYITIK